MAKSSVNENVKPRNLPSADYVRAIVDYCPKSGFFRWKDRSPEMFTGGVLDQSGRCSRWNAKYAGKPAFSTKRKDGYLIGGIDGSSYLAHRVAWLVHHGEWPNEQVDHINGDRADNRIENLRVASSWQNITNRKANDGASSGYLGVRRVSNTHWVASMIRDGVHHSLGSFPTEEAAAIAYDCASIAMDREFARPNILANPYLSCRPKAVSAARGTAENFADALLFRIGA